MRTHYCGELNSSFVGEEVELTGWVHKRRDHGGVIFLDIRDRSGIAQVVYDPDTEESFAVADLVRNEFVLHARGRVRARPDGTINPDMKTGEVEVLGSTLEILNASATPPFQLDEYSSAGEDVRLRYRYVDLRRPEMQGSGCPNQEPESDRNPPGRVQEQRKWNEPQTEAPCPYTTIQNR